MLGSWFVMQVEFKENGLCVRCEFLHEEVLVLQSVELLAFTSSSQEMHGYCKAFSELAFLNYPFSTPHVSVARSCMKCK